MFRIRRIHDDSTLRDQQAIAQAQGILAAQFPGIEEEDIERLPERLRDPVRERFRSTLFVAEKADGTVSGFALLLHAADLRFCYLDYIATASGKTGGGIGGALYERVREEAASLDVVGLFLECLPDEPALCPDPALRETNARRLRFYEQYDARPICDTAYETPLVPGEPNPPLLVLDLLGREEELGRDEARAIVRAILERRYGALCPPEYVEMVVESFQADPVRRREPRYRRKRDPRVSAAGEPATATILLVAHDQHQIHHVRERGYVESPVRIASIRREIDPTGWFREVPAKSYPERHILAVHDEGFVEYLKRVCLAMEERKSVYPYVFPIRNTARPPKDLEIRAGYYCIDTFTPLSRNAYLAARKAVDCTLTAAEHVWAEEGLGYALVRPPGHHAEHRSFGGFCYFCSPAVAAHFLSTHGRVAVLDVDYHHGNGQQEIFFGRGDVLTVSLHGHPRFAYPYFSGFADETGRGDGEGCNLNIPLPEELKGEGYREALKSALRRIRRFEPAYLVVALGLDTARGDPTGSWSLGARDFEENGRLIGELRLPTLVVQEGGYRIRSLGTNARNFFAGLLAGWGAGAKT